MTTIIDHCGVHNVALFVVKGHRQILVEVNIASAVQVNPNAPGVWRPEAILLGSNAANVLMFCIVKSKE